MTIHTTRRALRLSRKWRPNGVTIVIAILVAGGLVAGLYPSAAAWLSSVNQSRVIADARQNLDDLHPSATQQLQLAREYNDALISGVRLDPGATVPVGTGDLSGQSLDYTSMLTAGGDGLMARVRIPSIDVDLPVYHGTSHDTLLRGAGHLEGTHLPVGGMGTRSVITAHRGLANATMFTDLNRVVEGDLLTVETLGQVSTYQVFSIEVIDPQDSQSLRAEAGRDLLTLITCTPLGINTHRIVVTGERVTPTPPDEILTTEAGPTAPGFPFWIVIGLGGWAAVAVYVTRRGFVDPRTTTLPRPRARAEEESTMTSA